MELLDHRPGNIGSVNSHSLSSPYLNVSSELHKCFIHFVIFHTASVFFSSAFSMSTLSMSSMRSGRVKVSGMGDSCSSLDLRAPGGGPGLSLPSKFLLSPRPRPWEDIF